MNLFLTQKYPRNVIMKLIYTQEHRKFDCQSSNSGDLQETGRNLDKKEKAYGLALGIK